jgi:hypothetical protein
MQYLQGLRLYPCDTDRLIPPQVFIRVARLLQSHQSAIHLHIPDIKLLIQADREIVGLSKVAIDEPLPIKIFTLGELPEIIVKAVGKTFVAVVKLPATRTKS